MLNCEACELLIADALYEALERQQLTLLESHLADCEACRTLFAETERARNSLLDQGVDSSLYDAMPERNALDQLWDKLQPELDRIDAARYRDLPKRHRYHHAGGWLALAASLLLAIALLPLLSTEQDTVPPVVSEQLVSAELMNYLARAEVMLLLVANAETRSVSAVPVTQGFARNMALEANLLNTSMQDQINSGQSRLLKDIEYLLLQIANLDDSNMEHGVRLLQDYLEDNSVLFKIRLLEMRTSDTFI